MRASEEVHTAVLYHTSCHSLNVAVAAVFILSLSSVPLRPVHHHGLFIVVALFILGARLDSLRNTSTSTVEKYLDPNQDLQRQRGLQTPRRKVPGLEQPHRFQNNTWSTWVYLPLLCKPKATWTVVKFTAKQCSEGLPRQLGALSMVGLVRAWNRPSLLI